jgi:hypothetical protein
MILFFNMVKVNITIKPTEVIPRRGWRDKEE